MKIYELVSMTFFLSYIRYHKFLLHLFNQQNFNDFL